MLIVANRYNGIVINDLDIVLKHLNFDIVSIFTPTPTNFKLLPNVLKSKKSVIICEKLIRLISMN